MVDNNPFLVDVSPIVLMRTDSIQGRKCYSSPKFIADGMSSMSLPNSPSKENVEIPIDTGNENNSISSLLNISSSCSQLVSSPSQSLIEKPISTPINDKDSCLEQHSESFSSRSQSSVTNAMNIGGNTSQVSNKSKKSSISIASGYRTKLTGYRKIFKGSDVINEHLLADFSCAIAKNSRSIIVQGRLYLTENWICFYSKIISFENKIVLPISAIITLTKEKTAKVFPNAIRICTQGGKYFFTSFGARDKTFNILYELWNLHLNKQKITDLQKKAIIVECYGLEIDPFINEILDETIVNRKSNVSNIDTKNFQALDFSKTSFVIGDESELDNDLTDSTTCSIPAILCPLNGNQKCNNTLPSNFPRKIPKSHQNAVASSDDEVDIEINHENTHNSSTVPTKHSFINRKSMSNSKRMNICELHEHPGKKYLDMEIDMHVDKLFTCLFTNSHFQRKFFESRKTFDVEQSCWPEKSEIDGGKVRELSYTLSLKAKFGPKVSPSEEKQHLDGTSVPGLFYLVDTRVQNGGFLLCDSFHCENRFCLSYLNGFKSRLQVHCQIVYDKPVFFTSKSLIESTSKSGLADYFFELEAHLRVESRGSHAQMNTNYNVIDSTSATSSVQSHCNHHNLPHHLLQQQNHKQKFCHNSNSRTLAGFDPDSPEHNMHGGSGGLADSSFTSSFFRAERAWLILIVLSLIICLCLSYLYSRFRQLEDITSRQINIEKQFKNSVTINQNDHPNLQWKSVLFKERQAQAEEITQWKTLIDNSIDLLDQMRKVLVSVKSNLERLESDINKNPINQGQNYGAKQ